MLYNYFVPYLTYLIEKLFQFKGIFVKERKALTAQRNQVRDEIIEIPKFTQLPILHDSIPLSLVLSVQELILT